MRQEARRYRDEVYRLRSHPGAVDLSVDVDHRDSFLGVYASIFLFLVGEYIAEALVVAAPAGIVFPVGYLLFWAFFYTYYRPNSLEDRLADSGSWGLFTLPSLLLGVSVWFVKVTIVEFIELAIFQGLLGKGLFSKRRKMPPPPPPPAGAKRPPFRAAGAAPHATNFNRAANQRPQVNEMPYEVRHALRSLGLPENCRDWRAIHHRYRELAKRYHPDLNRENTIAGNRFIEVDGAYRKLETFKARYFGS